MGCICEEQAQFDVLQLFIGKGDLYNGIRTDLKGDGAGTTKEIGYLGQKSQLLDLNLVVNHLGKKTNSLIKVEGNHGATIGELDEETLFYFESRRRDKETAENIMTRSRLETLYHHIGDEETEKLAEQQLAEVLGDDRAGL